MPRPLRSPIREAFVTALLIMLLLALPSAGSPLAVLGMMLELGLLLAVGAILLSLETQRRARRRREAGKVHHA